MSYLLKHLESLKAYTPGQSIASIQAKYGLDSVIKLASNENPLGPAVENIQDLASALSAEYPDSRGHELSKKLGTFYDVDPNQIILGNGSDEVLMLLALACIDEGDTVLISDCTFSEYETVSRIKNARIERVPMQDGVCNLSGFIQALDRVNPRMIFLANPNNPTATIVSHTELFELVQATPSDTVLVIDEAYAEYVDDASYPQSMSWIQDHPNLIVLRTFSKVYGLASCRIGYGIGSAELIRNLETVRPPFNINQFALAAASLALDNQDFVQKSLKMNAEGKQLFYERLDVLGLPYYPSQANFVFMRIPISAKICTQACIEQGVIIRDMTGFGEPEAIRVTIGTPEQNQRFFEVLTEVLERHG